MGKGVRVSPFLQLALLTEFLLFPEARAFAPWVLFQHWIPVAPQLLRLLATCMSHAVCSNAFLAKSSALTDLVSDLFPSLSCHKAQSAQEYKTSFYLADRLGARDTGTDGGCINPLKILDGFMFAYTTILPCHLINTCAYTG